MQLAGAGTYTVNVSNAGGSVAASATLSVTSGGTVPPPVITNGPDSQTVPAGTNVTLTVEASGTNLTYQWQQDGTNIAGATSSSLTLTNVTPADSGDYTVIVSNPGGSTTSDPAVIIVTQPVLPPVIVAGPQSQTVPVGANVSFSVLASGQNLAYQWQQNGNNIAGATTSALQLANVQLAGAGTYTARTRAWSRGPALPSRRDHARCGRARTRTGCR